MRMATDALGRLTKWLRENGFTPDAHGWFERANVRVDIHDFSNVIKLYAFTDQRMTAIDWSAVLDGNAPTSAITHLISSAINEPVGV
jgi:hypothetical protein